MKKYTFMKFYFGGVTNGDVLHRVAQNAEALSLHSSVGLIERDHC